MSNVSSVANNIASYAGNAISQTEDKSKVDRTDRTSGKSKVYGKTVGEPQLSDKAAKYYESLKKKYSNMDFVLVSKDMKEQAKSQAASYANPHKMVVLIDEEKIEKMADDENFRKQYEGIIANAGLKMSQLGDSVHSAGANVKGYGMQVNDNGTATYFAVLEKSSAAQKERIEKNAEKKHAEKKAAEKKAAKEDAEEAIKERRTKDDKKISKESDDTVTVTANSLDELLQKIKDQTQLFMSDNVQTDVEKQVGQKFDFSV